MKPPMSDPATPRPDRRWCRSAPFILFLYLVIILFTWRDYGVTWDENVQSRYGELVLQYFDSGGEDRSCNTYFDLKYYGPVFELVCAAWYQSAQDLKVEIRHLCIALCAVMTVVAVALFGRSFGGLTMVFGMLALIMLPRFYGHSFNNSKDIPFACAFAWSMLALAYAVRAETIGWRHALTCGAAVGLLLATRAGGVFVFGIAGLTAIHAWLARRTRPAEADKRWPSVVLPWIAALVLCWVLMIAVWPWAHEDPLRNPLRAFGAATSFPQKYDVLFEGRIVKSDALPWYYLIKYIVITTPLALLAMSVIGIAYSVSLQRRNWRSNEAVLCSLLQLWLAVPLLIYLIKRPNIYDGLRHFLFVLPVLALFAGLAVRWVAQRTNRKHLIPAIAAAALLVPAVKMYKLHPYQASYFNFIAGKQPSQRYDTDYWVSSYKEAIEWVNSTSTESTLVLVGGNEQALACATPFAASHVDLVGVNHVGVLAELNLPDHFMPGSIQHLYYIGHIRFGFDDNFPDSPIVHRVGRLDDVYTVIRNGQP